MSEILLPRLQVPVPPAVYCRPRLEERLTEALTRRVLAVRAGPGYGKTTLLAGFANRSGLPVVWLQVDERDGDPGHLARYLLAGLARLTGNGGAYVAEGASPDELLAAVLNAIGVAVAEQPRGPLMIILNDVDLAGTPAATGFIGRLVDYLPGGATLWFTCRSLPDLPLARWKAVLLASELGEDDLAFTPEEVRGFCHEILGIELDERAAELLHRASSGWVAGLVLLCESRRGQDLVAAAQALLGTVSPRPDLGTVSPRPDPYAATPERPVSPAAVISLYQYMSTEILGGVRPYLQRFLMQSAVLPFLSVDACAAVMGTATAGDARPEPGEVTGDAGRLLEEAVLRTPLVFRLGEGRYVYHPMLRAFLLERLGETAGRNHLAMLYRRAGDYLASRGWRAEALDCYGRAEGWEQVAALLREYGRAFLRSGSIHALESWLDPLPREMLHGDPELLALLAAVRRAQGKSEEALALWEKTVDLAERALAAGAPTGGTPAEGAPVARVPAEGALAGRAPAEGALAGRTPTERTLRSLVVECRAEMAFVLTDKGDSARACTLVAPYVDDGADEVPLEVRAKLYHAVAWATWRSRDWERARVLIERAKDLYARAGDRRGEATMLNALGAVVHESRGDLERSLNCVKRAAELMSDAPVSPEVLLYRVNYHHMLYQLGRTAEAVAGLEELAASARQWGLGRVLTLATLFLGEAYLDAGRVGDALVTLGETLQLATETGDKLRVGGARYALANVHCARGELELALEEAREDLRLMREISNPYFLAQSLTNTAFVLLRQGDLEAAIAHLEEALEACAQHFNAWEEVRTHLGLALAYSSVDRARSRHHLERCLALCEGRPYAMIFRRQWDLCGSLLMEAATEGVFPAVVFRVLSDLGVEVPAVRTPLLPAADLAAPAAAGVPAPVTAFAARGAVPAAGMVVPAPAPSPTGVAVQCLGNFRVWVDGREVPPAAWGKSKALRLFKFLLANRRRWVPVEELLDALWPDLDPEAASTNLRVVLYHARRALSGAPETGEEGWGHRVLLRGHKRCRVDPSALAWLDADQFMHYVEEARLLKARGQAEEAARAYARADDIYRGDFLAEDPYDDWAETERERLRAAALEALEWLARHRASARAHGQAVALLRRAVGMDPCREDLHRLLMVELVADGRRAEALQQYRRCEEILARELDVAPAPETTALYRRLLQGPPRRAALA